MKKRFWFDKLNLRQKKLLGLHRDLTHHVEYVGKNIYLAAIKLIANEFRNLNKT